MTKKKNQVPIQEKFNLESFVSKTMAENIKKQAEINALHQWAGVIKSIHSSIKNPFCNLSLSTVIQPLLKQVDNMNVNGFSEYAIEKDSVPESLIQREIEIICNRIIQGEKNNAAN